MNYFLSTIGFLSEVIPNRETGQMFLASQKNNVSSRRNCWALFFFEIDWLLLFKLSQLILLEQLEAGFRVIFPFFQDLCGQSKSHHSF